MRIIPSPSLADLTTLRLGGSAIAEVVVETPEDMAELPSTLLKLGGKALCIGRGSNLLAMDGQLPLTLVRVASGGQIGIIGEDENSALVRASADVPLARLLRFCLQNGLSGMEGLCGIPGSVGGACAMNAGSFGTEMADILHSVIAAVEGNIKRYEIKDLQPGYRQMDFPGEKGGTIILEAEFTLTKCLKNVIFKKMNHNFLEKKSKQPITAWSAGCAFKNPPSGPGAGKLLDEAGWKGKGRGGMEFSPKHANFLVNTGSGTASAALEALEEARESVRSLFGVDLQPEIIIVP